MFSSPTATIVGLIHGAIVIPSSFYVAALLASKSKREKRPIFAYLAAVCFIVLFCFPFFTLNWFLGIVSSQHQAIPGYGQAWHRGLYSGLIGHMVLFGTYARIRRIKSHKH